MTIFEFEVSPHFCEKVHHLQIISVVTVTHDQIMLKATEWILLKNNLSMSYHSRKVISVGPLDFSLEMYCYPK